MSRTFQLTRPMRGVTIKFKIFLKLLKQFQLTRPMRGVTTNR